MGVDDAAMAFERIGLSPSFVQYVADHGDCFVLLITYILCKSNNNVPLVQNCHEKCQTGQDAYTGAGGSKRAC